MKVESTSLPGVLRVRPRIFTDSRGFFMEAFRAERYAEHGISGPWTQDNLSWSTRGTLRGLHVQSPSFQGKLVQVLQGRVRDVAVDVRLGSPSFGRWVAEDLDSETRCQLWIPPGFAHGFLVLSETALFAYKCSKHVYKPDDEQVIRWDDPDIGIEWGLDHPVLSTRDADAPSLAEVAAHLSGARDA